MWTAGTCTWKTYVCVNMLKPTKKLLTFSRMKLKDAQ